MKKIKMNNKEEIYVINQPKHIITSIILMDTCYPLKDNVHEGLFKLGEISDLIFVFSPQNFPVETSSIKKEKFTTLYQGCAFMEIGEKGLSLGLMKLLLYCQEIFNKHLGYIVTMASCMGDIKQNTIDKIMTIQGSSMAKPIFEARRLNPNEMYEFYKNEKSIKEDISLLKFTGLFGTDFINSMILGDEYKGYTDCRYCTWKSESSIMYFKNGVIKIFLDRFEESDKMKEIVKTFTDPDIRYLFANLTKLCGLENINYNIDNLEIGKL